jgi:hypothetical protein
MSDPNILAVDAAHFDATFAERKEIALKILDRIEGGSDPQRTAARKGMLNAISDSLSLRVAGRQHVVRAPWWKRDPKIVARSTQVVRRVQGCYRRSGFRGLVQAAGRRAALALG